MVENGHTEDVGEGLVEGTGLAGISQHGGLHRHKVGELMGHGGELCLFVGMFRHVATAIDHVGHGKRRGCGIGFLCAKDGVGFRTDMEGIDDIDNPRATVVVAVATQHLLVEVVDTLHAPVGIDGIVAAGLQRGIGGEALVFAFDLQAGHIAAIGGRGYLQHVENGVVVVVEKHGGGVGVVHTDAVDTIRRGFHFPRPDGQRKGESFVIQHQKGDIAATDV